MISSCKNNDLLIQEMDRDKTTSRACMPRQNAFDIKTFPHNQCKENGVDIRWRDTSKDILDLRRVQILTIGNQKAGLGLSAHSCKKLVVLQQGNVTFKRF